MKSVGGAGLVVIGLLFLYLAVSGKLDCFFQFMSCITSGGLPGTTGTSSTGTGSNGNSGGIDWGALWSQYGGKIVGGIIDYGTGNGTTVTAGSGISSTPNGSPYGPAPSVHH